MKRKEIADLIRSYRQDDTLLIKQAYSVADFFMVVLHCLDEYRVPDAAQFINLAPHDNKVIIAFSIHITDV